MRALLLIAIACDPAEPIDPSVSSIALGTGFDRFTPLEDGAEIPLGRGSQGGFHLDVALSMSGFEPAGAHLVYHVIDPGTGSRLDIDDGVVLKRRSLTAMGDGWVRLADRAFLDGPLSDRDVEIRAILERDGTTLEDRVSVHVMDAEL
jgi:hypothetical protein